MIPESFIQELKRSCDIESIISSYVVLKKGGRNSVGLCPFHTEKTPSFNVYNDSQSFYCFGCGAGGDVINFVKRIENLDYVEAVHFLADKSGMTVPDEGVDHSHTQQKTKILEINRQSARFFFKNLTKPEGKVALEYLIQRGLSAKTIKRFGLGFALDSWDSLVKHLKASGYTEEEMVSANVAVPSRKGGVYDRFRNRVMFPIIDLRGNVIAFGGRIMGDQKGAKYLNTSDTLVFNKSRNLFALNMAKTSKKSEIILCEGYMDVIALHQAGFDNAVATLGTSLTEEQARLLNTYTQQVILSYDSDNAGQKATNRAINIFDSAGIKVRVLSIEGAKDPDEFIKKFGKERFEMLLDGSKNAVEFEINKLKNANDIKTSDGKVTYLKAFCKLIADVKNPIEREVYIGQTAFELSVDKNAIKSQVESLIKAKKRYQSKKQRRNTDIYVGALANNEKDRHRAQNIKYVIAEQNLIKALIKNPDYAKWVGEKIGAEDFVTDLNKNIFSAVLARIYDGKDLELGVMGMSLTDEELSALAGYIAIGKTENHTAQATEKYIKVILERKNEKNSQELSVMEDSELKDYFQNLRNKKK